MDTQLIALTLIALVGLGVLMIDFGSEITGQGVKITLPKETLQKALEKDKGYTGDTIEIFTINECVILREIYWLRKELNLNLDRFDTTVYYCESAKGIKF